MKVIEITVKESSAKYHRESQNNQKTNKDTTIMAAKRKVKEKERGIPRWQLEGRSRKHASYSEILERCGRHTLQAKPPIRGKTLTLPHLQLAQRISTSC
jgi:hypothetical protein